MNDAQYNTFSPTPVYYPSTLRPPMNPLAVVSLVTALLGMAILPVILGHLAIARVEKTGERGRSVAVIGVVLGYLQLAVWALILWASYFNL